MYIYVKIVMSRQGIGPFIIEKSCFVDSNGIIKSTVFDIKIASLALLSLVFAGYTVFTLFTFS